MSFGALFTLRPRAQRARPGAAAEPFPAEAGWLERRESRSDRRGSRRDGGGRRSVDRTAKEGPQR